MDNNQNVMLKPSFINDKSILGIVIICFLLLPYLLPEYYIHVLSSAFLFAYLAYCWNIIAGYAGQLCLANGLFVGLGAYTSSLLFINFGVSPWLGMWLGAALATISGLFIGYPSFKYKIRGVYFAIVSLAFAEGFLVIASNMSLTGKTEGISLPLGDSPLYFQFGTLWFYYVGLAMTLGIAGLTAFLSRTKLGFYFMAIKENEDASEASGVNLLRYKLIALSLSAFLSAIGGTYYAQYAYHITPSDTMGLGMLLSIVLYAMLGGLGTIFGPAVGAILFVPLAAIIRAQLGGGIAGLHLVIFSFILVIVIIYMPMGIVGTVRKALGRWQT